MCMDMNRYKYYIAKFPGRAGTRRANRLILLSCFENTAQGVLCAKHHCAAVLDSHWALEITARACFEATWRSKSLLEQTSFFFDNPRKHHNIGVHCSHKANEIIARARFETI